MKAPTSTASKLGTRLAVFAMLATSAAVVTASVANGAAKTTTVAGTGTLGFVGDGATASAATLASPAGVAVDARGNLYIADTGNCRLREVLRASTTSLQQTTPDAISTIAGTACGDSGDGGAAAKAELSFPAGVAIDTKGNVYVADTGNNRIREIDAKSHVITTVAGNGAAGFSGDNGIATGAELDGPTGIAVDGHSDLFVADTNNCRVREVPTASGISSVAPIAGDIYTIAGKGTCGDSGDGHRAPAAELRLPAGVAVDAKGDVFVSDEGNRLVREVPTASGTNYTIAMSAGCIYTVAGSGSYNPYFGDDLPAASDAAALSFPTGIAVDAAGNLFVADTYGRSVREIAAANNSAYDLTAQAGAMYTVAGAGPAESPTAGGAPGSRLVYPAGVALDANGNVFVADIGNNTVAEIAAGNG